MIVRFVKIFGDFFLGLRQPNIPNRQKWKFPSGKIPFGLLGQFLPQQCTCSLLKVEPSRQPLRSTRRNFRSGPTLLKYILSFGAGCKKVRLLDKSCKRPPVQNAGPPCCRRWWPPQLNKTFSSFLNFVIVGHVHKAVFKQNLLKALLGHRSRNCEHMVVDDRLRKVSVFSRLV